MINYKKLRDDELYNFYFGSWSSTYRTSLGVSQGIRAVKGLFGSDFEGFGGHTFMGRVAEVFDRVANFEREVPWCRNDLDSSVAGSSSVVLSEKSGGFGGGAFISASSSDRFVLSNGDYAVDYFVSGGVSNKKKDGLRFKVVMVDSDGDEFDITSDIPVIGVSPAVVNKDQVAAFGGQNQYSFRSKEAFTIACLVFEGGTAGVKEFFDVVKDVEDGRICQKIIAE